MTENQERLIDLLSREIAHQAVTCAAEQHAPTRDPDSMDAFIDERATNVRRLREMRHALEEIFTGVIIPCA